MSSSPMNPVEKSFLRTSLSNTWGRRYSNERKFKEIGLQQRPFMFGTCRKKADSRVQICGRNVPLCPSDELQLTRHLPTRRQRGTTLTSSDCRANPNLQHGPEPLIMSRRQGRSRGRKAKAGRQARWGENSHWGKPRLFDPQVVSCPPRLPLTICKPGSHLSISGKATSTCSIAIASSPQQ